jgi:putative methyltransferase (TIGR04325 family)
MNIKDFIPPIWFKLVARFSTASVPLPLPPEDSQDHQREKDEKYEQGYDEMDVAHIILEKTKAYREQIVSEPMVIDRPDNYYVLLGILIALENKQSDELQVIDFGGGSGVHYFFVRAFLENKVKIRWHVVETPALVQASKELENNELKFFDSVSAAVQSLTGVDLMHSSGALQCTPDPYQSLRELIAANARVMLLSRVGLTRGSHDVPVLRESSLNMVGPGPLPPGVKDQKVMVPFVFAQKHDFDQILAQNYRIVLELHDGRGKLDVEGEPLIGLTYLAERR